MDNPAFLMHVRALTALRACLPSHQSRAVLCSLPSTSVFLLHACEVACEGPAGPHRCNFAVVGKSTLQFNIVNYFQATVRCKIENAIN
jgi:hypothetical protein